MTISQLQYVLEVAKYQSFTLASEKCFVTQPTLSMQIQKLEEELNIKIFDRSKKPIELTKVGKKIVAQAQNIVMESHRIEDIVATEKGFIGGDFHLGIIPTIMPTLLPMFLKSITKKYSKLKIIIEELNTEDIIIKLENGTLDAAIAATPLLNENLIEMPLYQEPFWIYNPDVANNKKEISLEELDTHKILLLKDGHCFKDNIINLCGKEMLSSKHFELQSGSIETLVKLADEGLGITLLPYLHTLQLNEKSKEKLVAFKNPKPAREVSILHHKNELKIHIIKALHKNIKGIIDGAIYFENLEIISPLKK
ncbi:MAG: hydrogen peroxide-inducible genes activator [Flavobacterium sp.]